MGMALKSIHFEVEEGVDVPGFEKTQELASANLVFSLVPMALIVSIALTFSFPPSVSSSPDLVVVHCFHLKKRLGSLDPPIDLLQASTAFTAIVDLNDMMLLKKISCDRILVGRGIG